MLHLPQKQLKVLAVAVKFEFETKLGIPFSDCHVWCVLVKPSPPTAPVQRHAICS